MTTNPFDLTGKTAIVTGASSGIGQGIAVALAAAGARRGRCAWIDERDRPARRIYCVAQADTIGRAARERS